MQLYGGEQMHIEVANAASYQIALSDEVQHLEGGGGRRLVVFVVGDVPAAGVR